MPRLPARLASCGDPSPFIVNPRSGHRSLWSDRLPLTPPPPCHKLPTSILEVPALSLTQHHPSTFNQLRCFCQSQTVLLSASYKMSGRNAPRGRGYGRGRGGRGGRGESRDVKISKQLSYILRHGAQKENIAMDDGGWANVADIVSR